jgi:hypothetical protein
MANKQNPNKYKYNINLPAMPSYDMLPESYRAEYTGTMNATNLMTMTVPSV